MNYIQCDRCGLADFRKENDYKTVWGDGPSNAKIVLIGEAPGADEAVQGKPFVGRSGKLLRQILSKFFNLEEQIYIINTVKCRPPENRAPTIEEQNKCFPYAFSQIYTIRPKVILTAGKVSSDWFSRMVKLPYEIYQPQVVELDDLKILWLPLYHPAYLLRDRNKIPNFEACLSKYSPVISTILKKV